MNLNVTSDSLIEEKEIVLKHLGIQLSKIRKNKNVTLEVMANKTFLSESYIRAIEKGLYACSIINFLKLCLALQVNPNVLLNELMIRVLWMIKKKFFERLKKKCGAEEAKILLENAGEAADSFYLFFQNKYAAQMQNLYDKAVEEWINSSGQH